MPSQKKKQKKKQKNKTKQNKQTNKQNNNSSNAKASMLKKLSSWLSSFYHQIMQFKSLVFCFLFNILLLCPFSRHPLQQPLCYRRGNLFFFRLKRPQCFSLLYLTQVNVFFLNCFPSPLVCVKILSIYKKNNNNNNKIK